MELNNLIIFYCAIFWTSFLTIINCNELSTIPLTIFCSTSGMWSCEEILNMLEDAKTNIKYELITEDSCVKSDITTTGIRRFQNILPPNRIHCNYYEYSTPLIFMVGMSCPGGYDTLAEQSGHWSRGKDMSPVTKSDTADGVGLITVGYRESLPSALTNVIQLGPSFKYLSKAIKGLSSNNVYQIVFESINTYHTKYIM